jgi:hypothetical protein
MNLILDLRACLKRRISAQTCETTELDAYRGNENSGSITSYFVIFLSSAQPFVIFQTGSEGKALRYVASLPLHVPLRASRELRARLEAIATTRQPFAEILTQGGWLVAHRQRHDGGGVGPHHVGRGALQG